MSKQREELRRGIRAFIQDASAELAEFTGTAPPTDAPVESRSAPRPGTERPILRLVREAPAVDERPGAALEEMTIHLPKKGVCAAYFVNKRCWELTDAFCNQALHICRLRECPIYDLHREEMERRYSAKFDHLW